MHQILRMLLCAVVISAVAIGSHNAEAAFTGIDINNNCHTPLDDDPAKTIAFVKLHWLR
jgi:hypothetical protein